MPSLLKTAYVVTKQGAQAVSMELLTWICKEIRQVGCGAHGTWADQRQQAVIGTPGAKVEEERAGRFLAASQVPVRLIRLRSKGVIQDLSIPDHERIGGEGEPGFCFPKEKGDFTHDLLALDLDRLIEAFR